MAGEPTRAVAEARRLSILYERAAGKKVKGSSISTLSRGEGEKGERQTQGDGRGGGGAHKVLGSHTSLLPLRMALQQRCKPLTIVSSSKTSPVAGAPRRMTPSVAAAATTAPVANGT